MKIEAALKIIHELTVEELKELTTDELLLVVRDMNEEDRGTFFIEKNIKIFGSIDAYIDDFLKKVNIPRMNIRQKSGARAVLERMIKYSNVSEENKKRIEAAIEESNTYSAAAAGGKRKRKTRGAKRTAKRR